MRGKPRASGLAGAPIQLFFSEDPGYDGRYLRPNAVRRMLSNSIEFLLLFLPLFLAGFYYTCRPGSRVSPQHWIVTASFCFYAYWDWRYLPLLIAAIAINHWIGTQLLQHRSRRLLTAGVVFNLSVLAFFKYVDFFLGSWGAMTNTEIGAVGIVLPLAISFTTFEHIAFLVDSYRGKVHRDYATHDAPGEPTRPYALHEYALFISYFPQLIAGPIFHHREMLPQFKHIKPGYTVAADDISRGMILIIVGLFKKVVIADSLARWVNPAFDQVHLLSMYDAWTAVLGYTLELYFDFSAYCEIAMGLGLLIGIRLPLNFNSPYKSRDIQEFWRRWHITLGRWLRDYLYIPLGGSQHGLIATAATLFTTFLLGGLWHGAGWQFVLWGALHGFYMLSFRLWSMQSLRLPRFAAQALTVFVVVLAWVPFRAHSIDDAMTLCSAMFGFSGTSLPIAYSAFPIVETLATIEYSPFFNGMELWGIIALFAFVLRAANIQEYLDREFSPTLKPAMGMTALATVVAFYLGTPSTFLYFQF
jgi:alginate O-acetyltransferase complex protein AlgI